MLLTMGKMEDTAGALGENCGGKADHRQTLDRLRSGMVQDVESQRSAGRRAVPV